MEEIKEDIANTGENEVEEEDDDVENDNSNDENENEDENDSDDKEVEEEDEEIELYDSNGYINVYSLIQLAGHSEFFSDIGSFEDEKDFSVNCIRNVGEVINYCLLNSWDRGNQFCVHMLDENINIKLKEYLENTVFPVKYIAFLTIFLVKSPLEKINILQKLYDVNENICKLYEMYSDYIPEIPFNLTRISINLLDIINNETKLKSMVNDDIYLFNTVITYITNKLIFTINEDGIKVLKIGNEDICCNKNEDNDNEDEWYLINILTNKFIIENYAYIKRSINNLDNIEVEEGKSYLEQSLKRIKNESEKEHTIYLIGYKRDGLLLFLKIE